MLTLTRTGSWLQGVGGDPQSGCPSAPAYCDCKKWGIRKVDLRARQREVVCCCLLKIIIDNLCLYQASSRIGGCNLARFGSPEPGLTPTSACTRCLNCNCTRADLDGGEGTGCVRHPPPPHIYFWRDRSSDFVWTPQAKNCTKSYKLTLEITHFSTSEGTHPPRTPRPHKCSFGCPLFLKMHMHCSPVFWVSRIQIGCNMLECTGSVYNIGYKY